MFSVLNHELNPVADNFDLIAGTIHSCADLPAGMAIGRIDEDGTPVFRDFDLSILVEYKNRLGCNGKWNPP